MGPSLQGAPWAFDREAGSDPTPTESLDAQECTFYLYSEHKTGFLNDSPRLLERPSLT